MTASKEPEARDRPLRFCLGREQPYVIHIPMQKSRQGRVAMTARGLEKKRSTAVHTVDKVQTRQIRRKGALSEKAYTVRPRG
jgi:hypothetical protein